LWTLSASGVVARGCRPAALGTVLSVSSPRTGSIGVPRRLDGTPVRAHVRSASAALGLAVVRTPELTIGAVGVLVAVAFAWVPSVWYDEAATVTSAQRSWGQLWAELHTVDAVHGLYYALMHAWFWLVGYTPFTLRLPSALAVGVAAALVVALGRRLAGLRVGVVAGIVFLLLPRVQWAGTEGRPYATITTLSVLLTLVGITAVRRTRSAHAARWWVAYGATALVAVTFNVYLSLAVVAHAVVLLWTLLAERSAARSSAPVRSAARGVPPLVSRRVLVRWAVAAGAAAVVAAPFVVVVAGQAKQVGWIKGITEATRGQVFATAWFGASDPYATVAWVLMALGVVAVFVGAHRRQPAVRDLLRAQTARVALPIVVVPTAVLLVATALGERLYSPKYASLSLPFVAVLIALALTTIRPKALLAAAVAVLLVVSVPTAVGVKREHAKQASHWGAAAAIIAEQRALHPEANEGVVFGSVYRHPTATSEIIRVSYPEAFSGLTDLAATQDGAETGVLWNRNGDLATVVPSRLGTIDTVWYVGGTARSSEPELQAVLAPRGFAATEHWRTGKVVITEFTRS
jgi:mannosyltransferase